MYLKWNSWFYREIRLVSSREQLSKLQALRKGGLNEGVEMETPSLLCMCSSRVGVLEREIHFLLWIGNKGGVCPCDNGNSVVMLLPSTWAGEMSFSKVAYQIFSSGESCCHFTGEQSKGLGCSYLPRVRTVDLFLSPGRFRSGNHVSSGLCVQGPSRVSSWLKDDPQVVVWTYIVPKLCNSN